MAEVKGKSTCSECGASSQDVKYDGRKYYLCCAECNTTTTYQSKSAQARIIKKMAEPKKRLEPTPVKAGGFFDSLNDIF